MLELLFCILVGTGALTILCAIFYGIAMAFHKGQATEEISPEEETYLQLTADMALSLNEISCALNAIASVHGDKSMLLYSVDEDTAHEESAT